MKIVFQAAALAGLLACLLTTEIQGQQLINNGDFESGFTGWTRADQTGSDGTWGQQTGTSSPVNAFTVPAPTGPTHAAMTDAQAGGSHVLYQDFVVPLTLSVATLQFDLYLNNHATAYSTPATLDFSLVTLNQQLRVDIIPTSADPFSALAADILLNVYRTQVGDPLVSGYNTITTDLTALFSSHLGETLRLRFAEADNVQVLNAGVDRVSLTIPEPSSYALLLIGLGLCVVCVGKKRNRLIAHANEK